MTSVENDQLSESSERSFFLVVAPGLVPLAEREVHDKWPGIISLAEEVYQTKFFTEPELTAEPAGLTLENIPLKLGFLLNSCLKIPTRILMRVRQFRCRDFPKLFNRTRKIDWPSFLTGCNPEVHVAAHKSRLMHHRRIEETVSSGVRASFKDKSLEHREKKHNPADGSVYVRFDHDECTVSLDTSGEALYRRTPGKKTGPAPIRENLAAAMFYKLWLTEEVRPQEGFSIVDPMAGSGTFLSEAVTFWEPSRRTGFAFRDFPFLNVQETRTPEQKGRRLSGQVKPEAFAFDQSQECVERARENFDNADLSVAVSCQDLFEDDVTEPKRADWVFVNPPYGRRLESGEIFPFYYKKILNRILEKWEPGMIGMIVPADQLKGSFRVPHEYKMTSRLSFLNGGLRVCFLILRHREKSPGRTLPG